MRIGSLFSGIGGLELGLEWAGVGHTVWQVEANPFCRAVLAKHWPDAARFNDVREVGAHNLEPVDVICGGFPCVEVSSAGKKRGASFGASALWLEFVRIVSESRPRFAVIENSADLRTRGLRDILGRLAAIGYDAEWHTLTACAVGAPHARRRLYIIAYTNQHCEPAITINAKASRVPEPPANPWHVRTNPPEHVRVDDGLPARMDRNHALGNAVVPQVAEVVGRRLMALAERPPKP